MLCGPISAKQGLQGFNCPMETTQSHPTTIDTNFPCLNQDVGAKRETFVLASFRKIILLNPEDQVHPRLKSGEGFLNIALLAWPRSMRRK